jgi:filamentous hemagglutinin family protein
VHAGNLPFVQSGTAGATIAGKNLTVNQTSAAAILNWKDFDIAAGNSVNFVQPSSTSSTLNRIWSGQPSTIAGQLAANGQIYLINQNGIVFANGAQVNVGGLTASTLDIPDAVYKNGLLSGNTDAIKRSGQLGAAFQANSTGTTGGVTVEQGATLTTSDGGRVMLLGTTVKNSGTISTPDGQTIMGAGTTVYLASTTDPSMRGLLIAVDGQQLAANSTATNEGTITAARGNVTIAGLVVNQSGTINATTSVNSNGSIYLVAGNADANSTTASAFYNGDVNGVPAGQLLPNVGGTLNLNSGSVTQVTADTTDKGTVTDTQVFNRSQVELIGQTVIANNGAKVIAPGGQIDVDAAANPYNYVTRIQRHQLATSSDGGQIYLDSGSTIDASGLQNVQVDASRNLIQIELGLNELQDDPVLRNGFLHGQTVTVDIGKGTPLLNSATLKSYANTIGRGVQEKLTTGGTISLNAGGDVITRAGSVQNVSGGSIAYQTSPGATSKLIGIDGKVYDISDAQPNLQYIAFQNSYSYTDQRWGSQTTFKQTSGQIAGYLQGADAGEVDVRAPQSYLRGQMLATTTPGPYQRRAAAGIASSLPKGGTLVLGDPNPADDGTGVRNHDAPDVVFQNNLSDDLGTYEPPGAIPVALPTAYAGVSALSPDSLSKSGFNNIGVYSNGTVTIAADSPVDLAGGGSLTITAGSVAINGNIHIPGGNVAVATEFLTNPAAVVPDNRNITLAPGAIIDVRGTWVNDSPLLGNEQPTAPTLYNGGSVSMQTASVNLSNQGLHNDIVLGAGSLIDVSGGGWVTERNSVVAGAGGSIALKTGTFSNSGPATGGVQLGGTLLGESLSNGGTLSITSAWASVDSGVTGQQGQLALTDNFFASNGFSSYSIAGINGMTIGSGNPAQTNVIRPIQQNLIFTQSALLQASGTDLRDFTRLGLLPDYQRAPTSLSFAATGSSSSGAGLGNLVFNAGTSILTDPSAIVSLTARENLTFLGKIAAPAGTISLSVAPGIATTKDDDNAYRPAQQLLIGTTAQLLAPGYAAVYTNNAKGYRTGQVLPGGNITIQAAKGSVVAETGSVIDVSGTSAVVDVLNARGVTPTTVAGSAGSIDIEARENIVLNGTLAGAAAPVSGAAGGSLTVGLSLFDLTGTNSYNNPSPPGGTAYPTNARNLTITADKTPVGDSLPVDENGVPLSGVAIISSNELTNGGFDNLTLKSADIVTLDGALSLSARSSISINAPQLTATTGTMASISAPYVALGYAKLDTTSSGEAARAPVPMAGNGLLAVAADQIDIVGHSILNGFGAAALVSSGDIRLTYGADGSLTDFAGSLATTGHLTLQAAQIYPTTATAFTLNPTDLGTDPTQSNSYSYVPGQVTILPGKSSGTVPLSALGTLTINGSGIDQYGTLRAPLGQIALNVVGSDSVLELHAGSLTSVAADGVTIPFGSTQNSNQWTYPVNSTGGSTRPITTLPRKQVSLNGSVVKTDSQSTVDLSGGGDLYAYEFVAGTGGSQDVLNPGGAYSYAILPGLGSKYAPIDYQYSTGTHIAAGREVYLTGVPGLADGYYALLPAHYALLPGAYAIRVSAASSDIAAGPAVKQPDGSYLATGRFAVAGTDILDSRTSSFIVAPGSVVRFQSQYLETTANAFFYAAAASQAAAAGTAVTVNLPADAGQIDLISSDTMQLNGKINFAATQFVSGKDSNGKDILRSGTGGIAAIEAQQIEVVAAEGAPDGALQLTADSLNALGASTLILGGRRSDTDGTASLTVSANTVTLQNSSADPLKGANIILAATGRVDLESGSAIAADSGSTASTPLALHIGGDGALLSVGSGNPITVLRNNLPSTPAGLLNIAGGASVSGGNLTLDSAGDTVVATDALLTAKRVTASSSHVNLGDVPANRTGLNLTTDLLATLKGLTDLSLHSDSTIDFYNTVQLGSLDSTGAPVLESITLDAKGLGGYGAGSKTLQADIISLTNVSGTDAPFTAAPDGTGSLSLVALASGQKGSGQLNLGAGSKYLAGFGGVGLTATGDIRAQGSGSLTLAGAGNLALQSAHVSTDSGATQKVSNTTGSVSIAARADTGIAPAPGVGGSLAFEATAPAGSAAIVQNGLIELPAGVLNLHAIGTGDIVLASGSRVDATGIVQPYADTYGAGSGGKITLWSDSGNISAASDSLLNVSGVSSPDKTVSSDAGSLALLAPAGHVVLGGAINGSAATGQHGGSFILDSQGSGAPFDVANLGLGSAGFTGVVSIRDRADTSVLVSGTVRAESFELAADRGSITVAGTIDTSGNQMIAGGGAISLWANNDLTLVQGSKLMSAAYAKAPDDAVARGGDITLDSQAGTVTLASGAILDPRGKAQTSNNPSVDPDGQITLRAAYDAVNGTVRINPILATIEHTAPATLIVEGVRSYSNISNIGDSGDLTTGMLAADLQDFATHSAAIGAALTPPNADFTVQVRPGIDISSTSDLTVGSVLDLNELATNSSGGAPINLTLRAAGNLIVGASISDGFVSNGSAPVPLWSLASGDSGTLRLTAGADLSAANPLATVRGSGDFILTPGSLIRTGTGSILAAAGRNICLGCNTDGTVVDTAQTSVIYTAGRHSSNGPTFFTDATVSASTDTAPEYPVGGGNVVIEAQGDITSAPTNNLVSNWLWRQGKVNKDGTFARNTAWWIDFARFQQGVGALGGGDVAVAAGGDITNLSAVIPTTGRVGKTSATDSTPLASSEVVNGGGNLRVTAGGSILSGLYQDDLGTAVLRAGGSIEAVSDARPAPLLSLANTQFLLEAREDVTLDGVYNSTMIGQLRANTQAVDKLAPTYFYTYAPDTTLSVVSTGGAVLLNNDQANKVLTAQVAALLDPAYHSGSLQIVAPPNLNITALSGDVRTSSFSNLVLFPATSGSINLLAQNDLQLRSGLTLLESDPALIGGPMRPGTLSSQATVDTTATLPLAPLHANDNQPARFVAATGSIAGNDAFLTVPKRAEIVAGMDIIDVGYVGKNLHPADVTLFEAGRDITYATNRDPATNLLSSNSTGITIQGPGFFEMLAGGNIDLGNSNGVASTGNLEDPRLSSTGATVLTGAGFGKNADGTLRSPAYDAFESTYIAPGGKGATAAYQTALLAYMKQLFPGQVFTDAAQAYASFSKLDRGQQLPFVNNILSDELNATGLDHTIKGTNYDRGYQAIATLFPTKDAAGNALTYSGDINMSFSQFKTEQGGDVDILAPGGSVIVGLPNPPPNLSVTKADGKFSPPLSADASLGLLVLSTGGIHGFADSSFEVNQSRILTLQGGDIILWSSNGDIDAGKGAKTAQGAPPPVVQTDQSGIVTVNPIGSISGSGIGQLLTRPDIVAGQVNLIAPKGTVNAGEAGIRAINLNIAALQVLNVGNIKVSGTATGVPTSDAGAFAGALSGANGLSDAGKAVAEQLNQTLGAENNFQQLNESMTPTFISVRMFCLGVQCTTD